MITPPNIKPPGISNVAAIKHRDDNRRIFFIRLIRDNVAAYAMLTRDKKVPWACPSLNISRCVSLSPLFMYHPILKARNVSSKIPKQTKIKRDHHPNFKCRRSSGNRPELNVESGFFCGD